MPSEFPIVTVDEVCTVCDGAHAKVERRSSGVMYLTSKNIRVGRLALDSISYISESDFDRLFSLSSKVVRRPLEGDVLMGIIGTFGTAYRVRGSDRFGVASAVALLRPDRQVMDPGFLYYSVVSPTFRGAHARFKSGSVQGYTNLPTIRRLPIRRPPLDEQRRIATVLGALDNKIELNRKLNQTLEEMAQAIFKSWFIDFDGIPDSEMVESECGPIPKGWEVGVLGDVAKQHRLTVKPEEQEPYTPYIGLADMPQRSIALAEWGYASDATSAKAQFVENDFLFGKLRPYFKKVGVAPCDGVCSSDIIVVRPKDWHWWSYTLGLLTLDAVIDFTMAVSTGTRMPRVSWKAMAGYKLAIPPKDRAEEFDAFVRPVVDRIKANIWQSRTLAELRDALLPKLVSGELRVPEAEAAMEAAL